MLGQKFLRADTCVTKKGVHSSTIRCHTKLCETFLRRQTVFPKRPKGRVGALWGKVPFDASLGGEESSFFFLWFQLLPPVSRHASPAVVAETMTSLPLRATNRRKEFQNESTSRDSRSSKQTAHRSAGLRSTVTISVDVDKKSINWQLSHKD